MAEADPHLKDHLLNDLSSTIDSRQSERLMESPAAPPTIPDHTLLRRIGKADLWLVVAAWELTLVEQAALAARVGKA